VSHIPQRKEKDCLNCGAVVQGSYCQNCGQENVVPHETFWHMLQHFLYDITHFDSKFFDSMKYLLLKPGFLPLEYMKGRRASYLNPVKKYVFTSAVFFIIFFSLFKAGDSVQFDVEKPLTSKQRADYIKKGELELKKNPDNEMWEKALVMLNDSTKVLTNQDMFRYWDDFSFISLGGRNYKNKKEYDSVQKNLPSGERDSWFEKQLQLKNLKLKEKYKNDPLKGGNVLIETFLHKLPYLLFASLPLFALILKLLYIRRKKFYYADHGIFSIYHYIFSFLLLLLVFGTDKLTDITGLGIFELFTMLFFFSGGVYLYLSMKRFYGQGHGKTVLKFLLLNMAGIVMMVFLFLVFILFSVFEI
jgi:hypothetical protein